MQQALSLVLGGGGLVGAALIKKLAKSEGYARVVTRSNAFVSYDNVEYIIGSATDPDLVRRSLAGVEICYHLVSTTIPSTSNSDILFDLDSNLRNTLLILDSCVAAGVKKIVFMSSGGTVYGATDDVPIAETHSLRPVCAYGVTKAASELYLELYRKLHGLDYGIARLANPYGPHQSLQKGQGVIPIFIDKIARDEVITVWGDGSVVRDYIFIEDAVEAIVMIADSGSPERLFNVGSGVGMSLSDLISTIEGVVGKAAKVNYTVARPSDVPINILDCSRLKRATGWEPKYGIVEGLEKTWRTMKSFY